MKSSRLWLFYAIITTVFWGVWGAFIEIPEKAGFPATLGYVVWSLTMIPYAIVALIIIILSGNLKLTNVHFSSALPQACWGRRTI